MVGIDCICVCCLLWPRLCANKTLMWASYHYEHIKNKLILRFSIQNSKLCTITEMLVLFDLVMFSNLVQLCGDTICIFPGHGLVYKLKCNWIVYCFSQIASVLGSKTINYCLTQLQYMFLFAILHLIMLW